MVRPLVRSLLIGVPLLVAARPARAQFVPPRARAMCDSATFRTPIATVVDTLHLRLKSAARTAGLTQTWADLLLDAVGGQLRVPRPLSLPAYDEAQPAPLDPADDIMEVEPSLYTEVRVTLRPDGHVVKSELLASSMSVPLDAAVLQAISAADSAGLLPPMVGLTAGEIVVVLALTRGELPIALRTMQASPSRAVAVLSLPRFGSAESIRAMGASGPAYPSDDRKAGRSGTVIAQFVVDTNGQVIDGTTSIVSYTAPSFATSVLTYLPTARFQPATIAGCHVPLFVQQPFEFRPFPGAPRQGPPGGPGTPR